MMRHIMSRQFEFVVCVCVCVRVCLRWNSKSALNTGQSPWIHATQGPKFIEICQTQLKSIETPLKFFTCNWDSLSKTPTILSRAPVSGYLSWYWELALYADKENNIPDRPTGGPTQDRQISCFLCCFLSTKRLSFEASRALNNSRLPHPLLAWY